MCCYAAVMKSYPDRDQRLRGVSVCLVVLEKWRGTQRQCGALSAVLSLHLSRPRSAATSCRLLFWCTSWPDDEWLLSKIWRDNKSSMLHVEGIKLYGLAFIHAKLEGERWRLRVRTVVFAKVGARCKRIRAHTTVVCVACFRTGLSLHVQHEGPIFIYFLISKIEFRYIRD